MASRMYNGRALGSQSRKRWRRKSPPTFTVAQLDGIALPKPKARRVVGWAVVVGLVAALGAGIPDAYSGQEYPESDKLRDCLHPILYLKIKM